MPVPSKYEDLAVKQAAKATKITIRRGDPDPETLGAGLAAIAYALLDVAGAIRRLAERDRGRR